jgi:hypothetical protein
MVSGAAGTVSDAAVRGMRRAVRSESATWRARATSAAVIESARAAMV